jgi:S1-C subfamily serine protease
MSCWRCGAVEPEGAQFCGRCGIAMAPSVPVSDLPPSASRKLSWVLPAAILGAAAMILGAVIVLSSSQRDDSGQDLSRAVTAVPDSTLSADPVELPDPDMSDAEIGLLMGEAVFRVEAEGCGLQVSGSAFAINDRYLVTNRHVVDMDPFPTLRGRSGETFDAIVIGTSTDPDLAVLETGRTLVTALEWVQAADLLEGEHIVGLGYPAPDGDFTVTPGSIISFQTVGDRRVAIRSDAAFDRGNSGGPVLTTSGKVAGVITQLADNRDGVQLVPLAFTADYLEPKVNELIQAKPGFEVDCAAAGVPPVLPYEIPDLPPIPTFTVPPPVPVPRAPTTTKPPCPSGRPTVTVSRVSAEGDSYFTDWWDVTVSGTVHNPTNVEVMISSVDVDIVGASYPAFGFVRDFMIPPGATSTWEATAFIVGARPTSATARLDYWSWSDFTYYGCPTG